MPIGRERQDSVFWLQIERAGVDTPLPARSAAKRVHLLNNERVFHFLRDEGIGFTADRDNHALQPTGKLERRRVQIAHWRLTVVATAQSFTAQRPAEGHGSVNGTAAGWFAVDVECCFTAHSLDALGRQGRADLELARN